VKCSDGYMARPPGIMMQLTDNFSREGCCYLYKVNFFDTNLLISGVIHCGSNRTKSNMIKKSFEGKEKKGHVFFIGKWFYVVENKQIFFKRI
jgi:hypothetical protein